MTLNARKLVTLLLGFLAALPAFAHAARTYSQPELDRMLAPVALYPDPLLSQLLMAATHPLEVMEAARWSRANPGLQGDDAVRAVQDEDWDPSVKSLAAFPQLLQRMDENLGWMQSLGEAFLAQEPQLMDTVQQLRRRAQAAGNLQSGEQIHVQQQGQAILVQPASPQFVYVPYYDPWLAFGPWWHPAYPPVAWAPWPGYARPYRPGTVFSFWWGRPVGLSLNFFFGNFDWHRRHVHVVQVNNYYYRPAVVVNRTVVTVPGRWRHSPLHRRDLALRAPLVQRRIAATAPVAAAAPMARENRVERRPEARVVRGPEARVEARIERRTESRVPQARSQGQQAQQQPARMPAAAAPPRPQALRQAVRQEQRQERREQRQEQRGHKG